MSLSKAFVAHMWRKTEDKRTEKNYEVSGLDALKNKARAVLGWFDDFIDKAGEFHTLSWLGVGSKRSKDMDFSMYGDAPVLNRDVSNLHAIRDNLKCKPFAWFLWRFRHIYVDGGLLPPETFQIQEVASGLCLTFLGPMGVHPQGTAHVGLLPCNNTGLPGHLHPDSQRFHMRNKNPSRSAGGKCCSAIGIWNSDQCIVSLGAPGQGGLLRTHVCDVSGKQVRAWGFTREPTGGLAAGQITHNGQCLIVDKKAQPSQITQTSASPQLKLGRCRKDGSAPKWRLVGSQVPTETALYEKALREQPELFKD